MDELGRKTPEGFRQSEKIPVIIVLDNIRSMMNTGSVFRTSDAFLLEGIILCGLTATGGAWCHGISPMAIFRKNDRCDPSAERKRIYHTCTGANHSKYQPERFSAGEKQKIRDRIW